MRVRGRITYKKVLGEENPADLLTKYMPAELMGGHPATINAQPTCGRAESAPTIDAVGIDDVVSSWVQGWQEKRVQFDEVVSIRLTPVTGLGRSCRKLPQTKWGGTDVSVDDCEEAIAIVEEVHTCGIGEQGRWVDWIDEEVECKACRASCGSRIAKSGGAERAIDSLGLVSEGRSEFLDGDLGARDFEDYVHVRSLELLHSNASICEKRDGG